MLSTFADLKASGIASRINLCPDDPRFLTAANRVVVFLLSHGSWWGTVRRAAFCVDENCITLPGCVASLEGIYRCCGPVNIHNQWYQFIPGSTPVSDGCGELKFQHYGTIPTARTMCTGGILRAYPASALDYGKTLTFFGHDMNGIWVRTLNAGVMQDGETVTLVAPWVETVTCFKDVTAMQKEVTNEHVAVFHHPPGDTTIEVLADYEYYETRPDYQRFQILNYSATDCATCTDGTTGLSCDRFEIEAMVKLEYMPMRHDTDYCLIGNIAAFELALEALKAKDDGDLAKADALMFGDGRNRRLGAIPILQQELRTMTGDRFHGRVNIRRASPFSRVMSGFI
jgi:hypothetical protein